MSHASTKASQTVPSGLSGADDRAVRRAWTEGPNSFFEDPPNAILSYVDTDEDTPSDAVVVLRDPVAAGSSLSYSFEVLEGVVPAESGAVTLFIDPLGRPLSPVSLAGMDRRDRRR